MTRKKILRIAGFLAASAGIAGIAIFSLPSFLALNTMRAPGPPISGSFDQFPVTVNPKNKTIVENARVNALFEYSRSPLLAAVENASNTFWSLFERAAASVAGAPWYQKIAAVAGAGNHVVVITPGMRKEQAANAFASALSWNGKQKQTFLTTGKYASLPLPEGSFLPGTYTVSKGTSPIEAQAIVNDRFSDEILLRYGTTTASVVPLNEALTIASLLEREAGGIDDMRLISGIIWNRLFANMNLQIDATVQYAKANSKSTGSWWPKVTPSDLSRKSPFNTYIHPGLPPAPISNPSVAAVLAALNPKKTSCLFYFHDNAGGFHCSETYEGHVALLKKYFGRGR